MGCAVSAPDSVIDGNSCVEIHNKQNLKYHQSSSIDDAGHNVNNQVYSDILLEVAQSDQISSFQDLDILEEPIIIKANANDLLYASDNTDFTEVLNADVKKGYVAFEVNLDGEVDPTIECKTKPLPKRLKHLAPLDGAPKLTAEELNEKLERAEQKRLKALAKRKIGTSRRSEKPSTTSKIQSSAGPDQTGDAPNDAGEEASIEYNQEESANGSLSDDNDIFSVEATTEKEITYALESQCIVDEKDDLSNSTQVFEAVDLYDSNNNAQECTERAISEQLVISQSLQVISKSRRLLHSVEEVEEESCD